MTSFQQLVAAGRAARLAKAADDTTIAQKALIIVAKAEANVLKNTQNYLDLRQALKAERLAEGYRF